MLFLYSLLLSFVVAAPYCSPEDSNSNKKTIEIIQSTIVNPINSFCTDLKNIENNKDTLHKPICSIFWKNGQAWWKKAAEEKPETLNKDSKEYKNPSRNQMLARGYAIASPAELIKWEVEFKALKSRTAPLCCGQDSECTKAYL